MKRNKVIFLLASSVLGAVLFAINPSLGRFGAIFESSDICMDGWFASIAHDYVVCNHVVDDMTAVLLLAFPVFLFSAILFGLADNIFRAWSRFVLLWIPLSTVLLYLSPRDADMFTDFSRESNAWRLTILFALISVLIVSYTWWANRKQ